MPFDQQDFKELAPAITPPHPARPATDEVLSTLMKAREWLSDPAHWTRYGFCSLNGRKMRADEANPQIADATCAWGACIRGTGSNRITMLADQHSDLENAAMAYLARALGLPASDTLGVADFNDDESTTHSDVLALFDRAIEQRRKEIA